MRTSTKLLIIFSVIIFLHFALFNKNVPASLKYNSSNPKELKYILFWTPSATSPMWYFGAAGTELFKKCKVNNCYATNNRTLRPIDTYDAVLFYPTADFLTDLPEKRSPHQRYIFSGGEAPLHYPPPYDQYVIPNFFNWTMSYRLDSDIIRRHGYVVERPTNYEPPTEEDVRRKTRSVAWFVSNCNSRNKRERLGEKLQQYIDVDIYGKCGTLSCPKRTNCHDMLGDKYKFYLSFENSLCRDYTTEKVFTVLRYDVVPVVYGGGDYEAVTPPHSVINVEDFESAEELAEYLTRLAGDVPRYLEYFKWKKDYVIELGNRRTVCQLCEKLNDPDEPNKVYEDIGYWWFNKTMSQCRTGADLPNIVL